MKECYILKNILQVQNYGEGPDIEISITPEELKKLIEDLNILKQCNEGEGRYKIQEEEKKQ